MNMRAENLELEPYFIAIGEMTTAWATLHEILGSIFSVLMLERLPSPGDEVNFTPVYVWHTIKSDRTQRDMLRTAVERSSILKSKDELKESGKWLLGQIEKLEDRRNDAVHSALSLTIEDDGTKEVAPSLFMRNPRAQKLSDSEDLLEELRCARDNTVKLFWFAQQFESILVSGRGPLPGKPELPGRRRKKGLAGRPPPPDS
jgi:hypothetical protein